MRPFQVTTSLLYGIFVSESSYLIGTRCLVKQEHASMFAHKATGEHLPQELVDLIADQLYELEKATVIAKWQVYRRNHSLRAIAMRSPQGTQAETDVQARIDSLGIQSTRVLSSRPTSQWVPYAPETVYIHLSLRANSPSISLNLPYGYPTAHPTSIPYAGPQGITEVTLTRPSSPLLGEDTVRYTRNEKTKQRREGPPLQASRLLQCDGIEDAIRNWDAEAIKTFVEMLDLKVIRFDEGDLMKPGLHVWQRILD